MRVITASDENYYKFVTLLEKNVKRMTGRWPRIYDLGMTKAQISSLNSEVIKVNVPSDFLLKGCSGSIKTTHKPNCILDQLDREDIDCLYIDTDIVLTSKISADEFSGGEFVVTPRHPMELTKQADALKNGQLNGGVIFVKNSKNARRLLSKWQERCRMTDETDQLALSNLLMGADLLGDYGKIKTEFGNIRKLDPLIYNDVACATGKIFHFKQAGRSGKKRRRLLTTHFVVRYFGKPYEILMLLRKLISIRNRLNNGDNSIASADR